MSLALALWLVSGAAAQMPRQTPTPSGTSDVPQAVSAQRPNVWLVIYNVLPTHTDEFEALARRVSEAMHTSPLELRRRQAAGVRVYRSALPNPEGSVVYFLHIPELTGGDDDRTGFDVLIDAVLPADATALKARLEAALDPRNPSGNTLLIAVH
jgi:hypothetical protein